MKLTIIQPIMSDKILGFINMLIEKGKVKINGTYHNYSIFKTIKQDNTVRKYIYLDAEVGYVEEAQLLTIDNEVLAIKPVDIAKQDDGLVIAFEFKLTIEEVSA